MKKLAYQLSLLLLFILNANLIAQNGWHWQHPDPQGNTLKSVSYCDGENGFAVGHWGAIIHTSNGGSNWNTQISGTTEALNDVCTINTNRAFIVGDDGIILQTADGGLHWYIQPSGTTEDLFAVSFTDENRGTVVGAHGTIMHTIDGGVNWIAQNCGTTNRLNEVSFSHAETGTVVGEHGSIYRTTDGGENWTAQQSGTTNTLNGVSFCNADFGFVIGTLGTILRTTDGGTNWVPVSITSNNLYDVSVTDPYHCTIVGKDKTVILLTDNGTSWTTYHQVGENHFYGACGGTIVGTGGQIFKTLNNGETWAEQKVGPEYTLQAVSFSDATNGTAVGDRGTILRTSDGGSSWDLQEYDSPSVNGSINDFLSDVCFTSNERGYVVSGGIYVIGYGFYYLGLIMRTQNEGANWSVLYNTTSANYYGVSFVDDNNGIAVGLYRKYVDSEYHYYSAYSITSNGGDYWKHVYFASLELKFTDVEFITQDLIIIIGESGGIIRSSNGADSFSIIASGTTENLNGVSFSDSEHGTIVGNNGTILRTTNDGISWSEQTSGTNEHLNKVSFIDNDNGMITGDNGLILRTIDGGDNWFKQSSGFYYDLRGASLASTNQGHVVGEYGTILKNENAAAICTYENISICEGESYLDWFESGAYNRTVTSSVGADSIITTFLVVNPVPEQPAISMVQDTLISTSMYGNQWYFNGMPIDGATDQKLHASQEGDYSVVVNNTAGCVSESSEIFHYSTGLDELWFSNIQIYPNPTNGLFTITGLPENERVEISVIDIYGKVMYRRSTNLSDLSIDISDKASGSYILVIDGQSTKVMKIIKK